MTQTKNTPLYIYIDIITGDICSKTNTWPISNTECYEWGQIERLGLWDPGPYPE